MPRVSVIVPTRNRPAFLADALGSVVGQDYRDLEIIVVDDASDDPEENARVIARFGRPIRHLVRDVKGGPSVARNAGIQASDSEYIAFLDDDDIWLPSKLRRQVEVFEANPRRLNRLGVVYCGHQWIDLGTGRAQPRRMVHIDGIDDLFRVRYNIIQTVLVRRACVEDAGGFDESMAFQENLEFLARVLQRYRFDWVEDVLVLCRTHAGPRTGDSFPGIIKGYEKLVESALATGTTPAVLHGEYYRLARCQMAAGSMRAARRNLVEAIRLGPSILKLQYSAFLGLSYVTRLVRPSLRSYIPELRAKFRRGRL